MRLDFEISFENKNIDHVRLRYENDFNDHIINNYLYFIQDKENKKREQESGGAPKSLFLKIANDRQEMEELLYAIYSVQKVSPSDKDAWNKAIDDKLPFLRSKGWNFDTIEFQKELWNTSVLIENLLEDPRAKLFYYHDLDYKPEDSIGTFYISPKL